jgi:hypothetical protein
MKRICCSSYLSHNSSKLDGVYVVQDHRDGTFLPKPGAEWSRDIADARRMRGREELVKTIESYDNAAACREDWYVFEVVPADKAKPPVLDAIAVCVSALTVESDDKVLALVAKYQGLLSELDGLPPGRCKSLAITHLEDSFSRAFFAVCGIDNPIRPAG